MMRRMAAPSWAAVVFLVVASSPVWAQQANAGGRALAQAPAEPVAALLTPAAALPPGSAVTVPAENEASPSVVDRLRPTADARLLSRAPASERELVHQPAYRAGSGVPLMIVGGAMFLAGAIIDDRAGDAVMVAGVVVAAIGLLQYLQ